MVSLTKDMSAGSRWTDLCIRVHGLNDVPSSLIEFSIMNAVIHIHHAVEEIAHTDAVISALLVYPINLGK